ncbi:MAG: DNA polymerase [Aliidongia sp.]
MERIKAFCREHGYVETIFGRKCHLPGIKDSNPARRAFSERAAINAPLQGAAADIIKRAMNRLPSRLAAEGFQARMLLQVHDETGLRSAEAEAPLVAPVIRRGHGRRRRADGDAIRAAGGRERTGTQLGRGALTAQGTGRSGALVASEDRRQRPVLFGCCGRCIQAVDQRVDARQAGRRIPA